MQNLLLFLCGQTVYASMYNTGGSLMSEAVAQVEVGIPVAVMLNIQSEQLCVGCQMPAFPVFPNVQTNCNPFCIIL